MVSRRTFLASLAALCAWPFARKAEPLRIVGPPQGGWIDMKGVESVMLHTADGFRDLSVAARNSADSTMRLGGAMATFPQDAWDAEPV